MRLNDDGKTQLGRDHGHLGLQIGNPLHVDAVLAAGILQLDVLLQQPAKSTQFIPILVGHVNFLFLLAELLLEGVSRSGADVLEDGGGLIDGGEEASQTLLALLALDLQAELFDHLLPLAIQVAVLDLLSILLRKAIRTCT